MYSALWFTNKTKNLCDGTLSEDVVELFRKWPVSQLQQQKTAQRKHMNITGMWPWSTGDWMKISVWILISVLLHLRKHRWRSFLKVWQIWTVLFTIKNRFWFLWKKNCPCLTLVFQIKQSWTNEWGNDQAISKWNTPILGEESQKLTGEGSVGDMTESAGPHCQFNGRLLYCHSDQCATNPEPKNLTDHH